MEQKSKVYMYETVVKWTEQRKGVMSCAGKPEVKGGYASSAPDLPYRQFACPRTDDELGDGKYRHGDQRERPQRQRISSHRECECLARSHTHGPPPRAIGKAIADDKDHGAHDRNPYIEVGSGVPGFPSSRGHGNSQTDQETAQDGYAERNIIVGAPGHRIFRTETSRSSIACSG